MEPGVRGRFLPGVIGEENAHHFYVLVCMAAMFQVGAMVRMRFRRDEAAPLQRLGRPSAATRSGASARAPEPVIRSEGSRADLASLRLARAIEAKSGIGGPHA